MNDVIVGAWRHSFAHKALEQIDSILERQAKGFRLFPPESLVADLAHTLNAYDLVLPDLAECHERCAEEVEIPLTPKKK